MNISVNLNSNKLVFGEKISKFSKQFMDSKLMPLVNEGFDKMVQKSGYTRHAVSNWFLKTFKMTPAEYYKQKENNLLKQEFVALHNLGFSTSDIAQRYNRSLKWAYYKELEFGLREKRKAIDTKTVFEKVYAGQNIRDIARDLGCSHSTVEKCLKENTPEGIVKYRHDNNISLLPNMETAKQVEQCFAEGKNIKETSEHLNIAKSTVIDYKKLFNLKTKLDLARDFMDKYLPDMIKANWHVSKMSKLIGLSKATILRAIKKLTGFHYKDIKNII